jgi:hypothetical protein
MKFIRTVSERFPNGRAEVELNYEASLVWTRLELALYAAVHGGATGMYKSAMGPCPRLRAGASRSPKNRSFLPARVRAKPLLAEGSFWGAGAVRRPSPRSASPRCLGSGRENR